MPEPTPEPAAATAPTATPQENPVTTIPVTTPPEPTRAAPPDLDAIRAEAGRAERERISGIDTAIDAARALMPAERVAPMRAEAIEKGWSADQLRRSLFDIMVTAGPRPSLARRPALAMTTPLACWMPWPRRSPPVPCPATSQKVPVATPSSWAGAPPT